MICDRPVNGYSCGLEKVFFDTGLRLYPSDESAPSVVICPQCELTRQLYPDRVARLLSYQHQEIRFAKLLPFLHQFDGVDLLIRNPYYMLGDEMGVAKSKQVIDAAQILYMHSVIDRVIVFAPANVRSVWCHPELGQIKKHSWLPTFVTEYHSKLSQWGDPAGLRWIVTNYDFVRQQKSTKHDRALNPRVAELLRYCTPKTLLVLDESSAVKTDSAQQTAAVKILRQSCGRIVELNGTPVSEGPEDIFSQANILHKSILSCPSKTQFRHRYAIMEEVLRAGGEPLTDKYGRKVMTVKEWRNLDDLNRRLAPYVIRRMKKDCLDLPEKIPTVPMLIPLRESWPHYKEMRDECLTWLGESVSTAPQIITRIMRLGQICSGFLGGVEQMEFDDETGYFKRSPELEVREVGREKLGFYLDWLQQRLEERRNFKHIVWSAHRPEVFRTVAELRRMFPGDVGIIIGGQKETERDEAKRLLDPDVCPSGPVVVVSSIGAGGRGTTLTAASCNFYMSNWWSREKRLQSEDRTHRVSQVNAVSYFDAVAVGPRGQKTIDQKYVETFVEKGLVSDAVMTGWGKAEWQKVLED